MVRFLCHGGKVPGNIKYQMLPGTFWTKVFSVASVKGSVTRGYVRFSVSMERHLLTMGAPYEA